MIKVMASATAPPAFSTGQILGRRWPHWLLLAEVIALIPQRQRLWLRPLCLGYSLDDQLIQVLDLREDSHLLWPQQDFEPVLDVEALDLLMRLPAIAQDCPQARSQLRRLMGVPSGLQLG